MPSSESRAQLAGPVEDFDAFLRRSRPRLQWRLRSRACAVVDVLTATAGLGLLVLAAVDSVSSWPADRVLVDNITMGRIMAVVLVPAWGWLLLSLAPLVGLRRPRRGAPRDPDPLATQRMLGRTMFPTARGRIGLALGACLCLVVLVGGFVVGAAKGDARVLPGPRYEVSTPGLHQSAWTPVSADEYALWQARFAREGGMLAFFGLVLGAGSLGLLRLHQTATRS